ncbi:ABC-2 type transport system permease protein [Agromyces flavus]|uniref:ABC-2 type transport system permease protein n=1 Tax=Agromyces flavus TaxID=589382 RepID=A0A1H1XFK7_9MICO|nr:ABC transporter permease [Agromyces flavus]MCP2366402.1 ABC-2 type transport system permease protein [Agromyces flavus]GGI44606.1 transport permease protein [Agromyces flavus]SDT07940.1 ABC-2 type transport system permease protein [Agromyces flavus]
MSTTTTTAASARRDIRSPRTGAGAARPGRLAVGLARIGHEVRGYFRSADTVFFTFLFPLIMLGIFTAAFSAAGEISAGPGTESISVGAYYLPGMLAAGMLLSGVQNLAVDIAGEKSDGTLKRLGGTPLSPVSYFLGKIGQVFVTGTFQAALLLLAAGTVFGIALPTEPEAWMTFAWVFVLGIGTSALLGIALSSVPRSGKSASAVVVPIMLVLQFISGVYLQFYALPDWMQNIASLFPLKWMAQGMRSVFLPEDFAVLEQHEAWNLGWVAVVLIAWLVIGLVVSRLTFRWIRRDA